MNEPLFARIFYNLAQCEQEKGLQCSGLSCRPRGHRKHRAPVRAEALQACLPPVHHQDHEWEPGQATGIFDQKGHRDRGLLSKRPSREPCLQRKALAEGQGLPGDREGLRRGVVDTGASVGWTGGYREDNQGDTMVL